jgi:hypothetical protein
MPELQDDKITGLQHREQFFPTPFGNIRAAAAASESTIHDVDFRRVKEIDEWLTPTPLSICAIATTVANG